MAKSSGPLSGSIPSASTMGRRIVPSGIPSLDKIIEGGFNEGDTVLIAGQPGVGKSTFGAQFVYFGAEQYGQVGILASFVESASKLKRDMLRFNWDFAAAEKDSKVLVLDLLQTVGRKGVDVGLEILMAAVNSMGAKRLVIDSLSALMTYIDTKAEARSFMGAMNKLLENAGCTSLFILEVPWGDKTIGLGFEEFMTDGLVVLESSLEKFKVRRKLFVPKMRGLNHSLDCFDFFITP
ncbi:MAG: RAD55 family ATPase, partial [Candidatus Bathyarchaeia archaeon]